MFADAESTAVAEIFASLQDKIGLMYNRPYLAQGTAERSLILTLAILEVSH